MSAERPNWPWSLLRLSHGRNNSQACFGTVDTLNSQQAAHRALTYSQFANFMEVEAVLHIISRKRLLEVAVAHGDLFEPLDHWYRAAKQTSWRSIDDVRQMFPSAEAVGKHTVFNVKGNRYRLIVEINYLANRIYIRHVLTHAEYDKGAWKR